VARRGKTTWQDRRRGNRRQDVVIGLGKTEDVVTRGKTWHVRIRVKPLEDVPRRHKMEEVARHGKTWQDDMARQKTW
jgi:hypothetical protein